VLIYANKRKGLYLLSQMRQADKDQGATGNKTATIPAFLHLVQERIHNR
jgi:hypothetical protein